MRNSNPKFRIFVGSLLVAILIFAGVAVVFNLFFPRNLQIMQATPILQVIPASTPTVFPTGSIPFVVETQVIAEPGGFALGDYVQVTGTGIDGLRFRQSPSKSSETLFIAMESEVFKIQNGPESNDGYTWWYLTAPYDQNRSGWVVADYLSVLSTPSP